MGSGIRETVGQLRDQAGAQQPAAALARPDRQAGRARQRGISLSGLLVVLVLAIFAAIFGFKLIPPYMQYLTIQKVLSATVADPGLKEASPEEFRKAYSRRAQVEGITAITAADLQIEKRGAAVEMSAGYSVKVPLAGNASICIDFVASSSAGD